MASVLQKPEVGPGDGHISEDARRLIEQARAKKERQKQSLRLQRQRILSQEISQPARRAALEAALAQVNGQLANLG